MDSSWSQMPVSNNNEVIYTIDGDQPMATIALTSSI